MNRFWRRLDQLARPLDPHDPVARGADLDRRSVGDLFDDLGLSGLARFLLEIEIRDDYGVEADRLSLLYAAQADRLYWNVYDRQEEVFRIRGGNGRLVEAFARRLGDSVRLSAPVTAVTQLAGGVRVSAGGGEIEADYCVLAAPLPALRAIHFSPALGSPLREAVAELQYGAVTKNVLQYRQRFWRQRGVSGDAYTDLALGETWEATDQQDGRRGILIAYAAGDRSARFEREAADERLGEMARQVGRIWPGSERLAGEGASVAWVAEPSPAARGPPTPRAR